MNEKQQRILTYIRGYVAQWKFAPTLREIAINCGISSTSVVNGNLYKIQAAGYIKLSPGRARGIVLVENESLMREVDERLSELYQVWAGCEHIDDEALLDPLEALMLAYDEMLG